MSKIAHVSDLLNLPNILRDNSASIIVFDPSLKIPPSPPSPALKSPPCLTPNPSSRPKPIPKPAPKRKPIPGAALTTETELCNKVQVATKHQPNPTPPPTARPKYNNYDWTKTPPVVFDYPAPFISGKLAHNVTFPCKYGGLLDFLWEEGACAYGLPECVRHGGKLFVFIVDPDQAAGFRFCVEALNKFFGICICDEDRFDLSRICNETYRDCHCDQCCEPKERCEKPSRKYYDVSPVPFPIARLDRGCGPAVAWSRLHNPPIELRYDPEDPYASCNLDSRREWEFNAKLPRFLNPKRIRESFPIQHEDIQDAAVLLKEDNLSELPVAFACKFAEGCAIVLPSSEYSTLLEKISILWGEGHRGMELAEKLKELINQENGESSGVPPVSGQMDKDGSPHSPQTTLRGPELAINTISDCGQARGIGADGDDTPCKKKQQDVGIHDGALSFRITIGLPQKVPVEKWKPEKKFRVDNNGNTLRKKVPIEDLVKFLVLWLMSVKGEGFAYLPNVSFKNSGGREERLMQASKNELLVKFKHAGVFKFKREPLENIKRVISKFEGSQETDISLKIVKCIEDNDPSLIERPLANSPTTLTYRVLRITAQVKIDPAAISKLKDLKDPICVSGHAIGKDFWSDVEKALASV